MRLRFNSVRVADNGTAAILVIDFYLDENRDKERVEILRLVGGESSDENEELLVGYVREAMRLSPAVSQILGAFLGCSAFMLHCH